ncbi:hypothetical protein [Neisseria gonorrhoeae]|uniref:hypothetical protein n=1 Tax=Neisseria gonorrhoeae TaxID=485 RepID=UPI0039BE1EB5
MDPIVGLARARGRGELDRIEQMDLDFFHRTRARYLELVKDKSKFTWAFSLSLNFPFTPK